MIKGDGIPLAVRIRPQILEDFVGQQHILSQGSMLYRAIKSRRVPSFIFWGPPGCGKTTLGHIISREIGAEYKYLNAAFSSSAQVKKIIVDSRQLYDKQQQKTVIFVDEFHRFNKLQQEALVPDTEVGSIYFIGTTIHKPYHYVIPSLISRSIISEFKPLQVKDIIFVLNRALANEEKGLGKLGVEASLGAVEYIAANCGGDARSALTALELGVLSTVKNQQGKIVFDLESARQSIQRKTFYDKKGSYHYDTISAFIKSVRGSDVDSSLFWLAKMIKGGQDARFIARRLIILASEDIGNANPFALVLATNCFKSIEVVGPPEEDLILAQVTIYLASSPKSNTAYMAIKRAKDDAEHQEYSEVPKHLMNHSTNYKYPHSFGGYVKQDYGAPNSYYCPKDIGEEKKIKKFLEYLDKNGKMNNDAVV
ncbi:MAG: replication-associated recombination protein A [Candidatus Omnitrophota bacterium]|nr:replication-associated recombination protein A [Candidatus Omnitrophota bacterium]